MTKKIKVLAVDDSASVRETLKEIISADPELEMRTAADPYAAAKLIAQEVPDVIILDVEMPRMDGITFLRKIMQQRPIPVVMCSSLTGEGTSTLLEALEAGAVDVIQKPRVGSREFLLEARIRICDAVKAAARARLRSRPAVTMPSRPDDKRQLGSAKLTADVILPPPIQRTNAAMTRTTETVVCIGASTGGTESLRQLLETFPEDTPGTVIVQHMPEKFTEAFAQRLDNLCTVTIKEARDGDTILRGQVLIAPGNRHTLIRRSGARYFVEVRDGPLVCRHRPSVDVLFRSAAQYLGANAVGVLMTGMGDDGARGLLEMMQAGSYTIAEDESSCVVFGMPREAIKLGAARIVLPLSRIRDDILRNCAARERA
ncbi:MAG: chemotaxis response regulator protein-glutamate methylesterase [Gammaproteobacteria bacterium]|nr:chemotaxis response regulator protein-glutamate methylesterase [Gammaproteobacteria bacterium]